MNRFTSRFADKVVGVLSGFDRLALRGTLRAYSYEDGLGKYLSYCGVLLKDFSGFVEEVTKRVREASLAACLEAGREVRYLPSSQGDPAGLLGGKRVRGLNPLGSEDAALLCAVGRGEFVISGLRNRDRQRILFKQEPASPQEAKRRSGVVTRKLRLLRAHGIITKVQHTNRYQVTTEGRRSLTAIAAARRTPVDELLRMAA